MTARVSVVVPTCRRSDLLRRCLAALAAQDLDSGLYEIIVVDDAASEATRKLVESGEWALKSNELAAWTSVAADDPAGGSEPAGRPAMAPRQNGGAPVQPARANGSVHHFVAADDLLTLTWPAGSGHEAASLSGYVDKGEPSAGPAPAPQASPLRARYIPVAGGPLGPAAARNLGWRAAEGEIIAFTDDDCIPAPGWLAAGLAAFAPGVAGVSGRILMPLAGTPTDYELDATALARSEFVTANCFYRRAALAACGGFDERFRMAWREDSDLFFTLLEESLPDTRAVTGGPLPRAVAARFRHAPSSIVVHPVRPAPWGISLRQQRKNMYNALLYKKHAWLYRTRLGASTPWRYYAILAVLLAVPAALLLGQAPSALTAAGLWLILTLRFAAQRLEKTSHAPTHVAEMLITSTLIPPLALFWRLVGVVKYRVWFL